MRGVKHYFECIEIEFINLVDFQKLQWFGNSLSLNFGKGIVENLKTGEG